MMRQRPVGSPPAAGLVVNSTPAARMSCPNTAPSWSSLTRPMNAAEPPNDAMPTMVLAADPPEISAAGPIAAYSCSARSGVDERHGAAREAVGVDELVGFVAQHVDEGVADPDDVDAHHRGARSRTPAIETGMPVAARARPHGRRGARRAGAACPPW